MGNRGLTQTTITARWRRRLSSSLASFDIRKGCEVNVSYPTSHHYLLPPFCVVGVGLLLYLANTFLAGASEHCKFLPDEEGNYFSVPWGSCTVISSSASMLPLVGTEGQLLAESGEVMDREWRGADVTLMFGWSLIWVTLRLVWGFPGGSDGTESACNAGDLGPIPGLGRCPGEGNVNPLQYYSLENSIC